MRWELDNGKFVDQLKEQSRKAKKVVERLKKRPTLRWYHKPYFEAFLALHRKRQVGFSVLPIPGSEIYFYIKIHDFDDDAEFFYKAISEMDAEYMSWASKKAEADEEARKTQRKNQPKSPAPRRGK